MSEIFCRLMPSNSNKHFKNNLWNLSFSLIDCCNFVKNNVYLKYLLAILTSCTPRAMSLVCNGDQNAPHYGACFLRWSCSLSRVYSYLLPLISGRDQFNRPARQLPERLWWLMEWREDNCFPHSILIVSKNYVRAKTERDIIMPPFLLLLLIVMIFVCAFGYMTFRHEVERRVREKKRTQYHDRV
jgi:hypothetical protein